MIFLALPVAVLFFVLVSFVGLQKAKQNRISRRLESAWWDKREARRQSVAEVVDIRGWRTFRARREEQGIA